MDTTETLKVAIIVDDLAADRQLASLMLKRQGWKVYALRDTRVATATIEQVLNGPEAGQAVIITDLNMPGDPTYSNLDQQTTAGANFALHLRARMERNELPRVPIAALTALTETEILVTAQAFGCDLVLAKPATWDLGQRIIEGWKKSQNEASETVGAEALLKLLRCRLASTLLTTSATANTATNALTDNNRMLDITTQTLSNRQTRPSSASSTGEPVTEQDITRALLAYRRSGLVGLGESSLAKRLAAHLSLSVIQRGEYIYNILLRFVNEIMQIGSAEAMNILQGELVNQTSPAEQCTEIGLSLSEYYRRRHEAIMVLLELLSSSH